MADEISPLDPRISPLMDSAGISELNQIQRDSIPDILEGRNVVLVSPTGSGKTEAAVLPILSRYLSHRSDGVAILYITPLRALNRDILKRLEKWAEMLEIKAEVRHGDTSRVQRRRQAESPPELLITTPETLQALLVGKRMRRHVSKVRWVIVDEIHSILDSKRGAQLAVGLERLALAAGDFQRVGLSATLADPELAGKFLCGPRPFEIKSWDETKPYRVSIEYPEPKPSDLDLAQDLFSSPEAAARIRRMRDIAESHRSVLIFANARTLTELLGHRLSSMMSVGVHHGSVSKEERAAMEDSFKEGGLPAMVCTSTLELGIDIGFVDYVIQYLAPLDVSSFVQRFGRSGHRMGRLSQGSIICTSSEQVRQSIAVARLFLEGELESVNVQDGALDVLSHQLAGLVMDGLEVDLRRSWEIIRCAYPYRDLDIETVREVIHFMQSLGTISQSGTKLSKTGDTWKYYYQNLSMIPDERRYPILDEGSGRVVGNLGEEFVALHCTVGLDFICRGKVWRITEVGRDGIVRVKPSSYRLGAIPGWDGELPPVPREVAYRSALLSREMDLLETGIEADDAAMVLVEEEMDLERAEGVLPDPNELAFEISGRFLVLHSPFGSRINRTLLFILDELTCKRASSTEGAGSMAHSDAYRVMFEFGRPLDEEWAAGMIDSLRSSRGMVEELVDSKIERGFPFILKHIATRFGAIPRGVNLFDPVAKNLELRYAGTPIYEEGSREGKLEKLDLAGTEELLGELESGGISIRVIDRTEEGPSSRARKILERYTALPELGVGTSREATKKIEERLLRKRREVRCFVCGHGGWKRIGDLPDQPECESCGSRFLTMPANPEERLILRIKMDGTKLENREVLARLKQKADLVSIYGRKAMVALAVRGIGPQSASRILSRMYEDEEDFVADLVRASASYEATRQYWD